MSDSHNEGLNSLNVESFSSNVNYYSEDDCYCDTEDSDESHEDNLNMSLHIDNGSVLSSDDSETIEDDNESIISEDAENYYDEDEILSNSE